MTSLIKREQPNSPRTDPVYAIDIKEFERFKSWVSNTSLFKAIVQHSGTNVKIEALTEEETLLLSVEGKKITKVDELPKEFLIRFLQNSPWANKFKKIDFSKPKIDNLQNNGDEPNTEDTEIIP